MKPELLDLLACPACRSPLDLSADASHGPDIVEANLICTGCKSAFAIAHGVPRIFREIVDGATAERFAYEWRHFPELSASYESQFLDWIAPIDRDFFKGKTVLDAGCGKGRHTLLAARFGADRVVGLDLSQAIDVALTNTHPFSNIYLIQGDLCRPPLRQEFDYVYCIGVLHHLLRPEEGFKALSALLKTDGTISIWVYGREGNGWIVYFVNPLRKLLTSKLPMSLLKVVCLPLAGFLYAICKIVYRPVNLRCNSLARCLFYNEYLFYISQFDLREIYSIVFDHFLAPVAFYLRKEEVLAWFETQFTDVKIAWHHRNSWRVTARKIAESGDAQR